MATHDEHAPEATTGDDAAKPTSAPSSDGPLGGHESRDEEPDTPEEPPKRKRSTAGGEGPKPNNVRKIRIEKMLSKAELARRANVSVLTIDRVEKGFGCRVDTKRKILEALGLSLADRVRVFGEEE
jgi:DNA-binding XRE family transcriptional regulator